MCVFNSALSEPCVIWHCYFLRTQFIPILDTGSYRASLRAVCVRSTQQSMNTGACGVVSIALFVSSFVWSCVAVHSWSIWSRVSAINSMLCSPHPTLCFKTVPLLCLLYAPRYYPAVGLYDTCSWYELFHTYGSTILQCTAPLCYILHQYYVCFMMSAIQLYAMYECVHVRGNLCAGNLCVGNLCVQYALLSDMRTFIRNYQTGKQVWNLTINVSSERVKSCTMYVVVMHVFVVIYLLIFSCY